MHTDRAGYRPQLLQLAPEVRAGAGCASLEPGAASLELEVRAGAGAGALTWSLER